MNEKAIPEHIDALISRYPALETLRKRLIAAAQMLVDAYYRGGKLLVCGNGGSAADAEHIVGELMKSFTKKRPLDSTVFDALCAIGGRHIAENLQNSYPAIALTGALSLSTAFANDVEPQLVFAQQVLGYGRAGDIFMGITTSGNSKNVIDAALTAKAKGLSVIGLTGQNGGEIAPLCDILLNVPESETYKIQELHIPVYHALCLAVEWTVF